jgi:hypothetical protein
MNGEVVATFARDGFVRLGEMLGHDEMGEIQAIYDEIIAEELGMPLSAVTPAMFLPGDTSVLTVTSPESRRPELQQMPVVTKSRTIAQLLLGCSSIVYGWRFFYKPAGFGRTSWHQDAAYRPAPHDGMSIWIPLDPVGDSFMQYLPGTHRELKVQPHQYRHHHMELENVNSLSAVACPIPPGHGLAHHCRVIHAAGPAPTSRRAVVLVFSPVKRSFL